jgi:hypothetical protein
MDEPTHARSAACTPLCADRPALRRVVPVRESVSHRQARHQVSTVNGADRKSHPKKPAHLKNDATRDGVGGERSRVARIVSRRMV